MSSDPVDERVLSDFNGQRMSWAEARKRLENPEFPRTYWLTTVRPDGRPHVMPVIGLWQDDALYFLTGANTRKGKNLAADGHSVIAAHSPTLPSVDIVMEGRATRVTDDDELRKVVSGYGDELKWPLQIRDGAIYGPNAPSAGPPPYAVWRFDRKTVFGLPGLAGSDTTEMSERVEPIRWRFASDAPPE